MANIIRGLTRLPIVSRGIVCSINIVSEKVAQVVRTILEATLIKISSIENSYYKLSKPWVPTGNFKIKVPLQTRSSSGAFIGGSTKSRDGIYLDINSGKLRAFAYVGTTLQAVITDTLTNYNDGVFHIAELEYQDTIVKLFMDGVEVASGTWVLDGNQDILFIGSRENSTSFTGILHKPELLDLTTPANSLYFVLGELTKDYELPSNNVFGSELADWSSASQSTLGPWVWDGVSKLTKIIESPTVYSLGVNLVAGNVYTFTYTKEGHTQGNPALTINGSANNFTGGNKNIFSSQPDGTYTITLDPKVTGALGISGNIAIISLLEVAVKQVTNALDYVNIDTLPDVRAPVTLVDGAWIGSERWDNVTSVNDWVDGGDGVHTVSTTIQLNNSANMTASSSMVVGDEYLCKFVESGFTGNGKVGFRATAFTGVLSGRSLSADGLYSGILTAGSTTPEIFRYVDSGTGTSRLSQISVREYIGIAAQAS